MSRRLGVIGAVLVLALLTGCGASGNPATGMNAALADYLQAQAAFGQMEANASESTITAAWIEDRATKLSRMRMAFEALRSQAQAVDFPETAGVRGQPAQATVDEYLAATDAYITINEQVQLEVDGCLGSGGRPFDCVMQVGSAALLGIYPDVLKRAQEAALQLQAESSRA